MRPLIQEIATAHTPESLVECLRGLSRYSEAKTDESGVILLRTSSFDSPSARYSFVAARPFLTFRSFGSRCEIVSGDPQPSTFNNSSAIRGRFWTRCWRAASCWMKSTCHFRSAAVLAIGATT
jgi:hypothetical protein